MSDSRGRDDDVLETRQRLIALEQRLAALEQWLGVPPPHARRPVEAPPTMPPPAVAPPVYAEPPPVPPPVQLEPPPSPFASDVPPPPPASDLATHSRVETASAVEREDSSDSPLDFESLVGRNLASWAGGIVLLLYRVFEAVRPRSRKSAAAAAPQAAA